MGAVNHSFCYKGRLSSSKSLFNRALIIQSYFPQLQLQGFSQCNDVQEMKRAIELWRMGGQDSFHCGAAGTTFRFLLARLSREKGSFNLTGDERLFSRPHQELFRLLESFGVQLNFSQKNTVQMKSQGWILPQVVEFDLSQSSQFASAFLLNAWMLDQDVCLRLGSQQVSMAYFAMTLNLVKELGMHIDINGNDILIPAGQKIDRHSYCVEPDMSSTFSLAAFAATKGKAEFQDFPLSSLQPDAGFMRLFEKIGIPLQFLGSSLQVEKCESLKPIRCHLSDTPDLFPVLAVLLSMAEGTSTITGIDHLAFKESNRIENTLALLQVLGRKATYEGKRFVIEGKKQVFQTQALQFDCDQDHRMAMAVALANQLGASIEISDPGVVDKSFPEFWQVLQESGASL